MNYRLRTAHEPSEADRLAILAPLRQFNVERAGDQRVRPVAILIADDEGATVGGLWGRAVYDWLYVELLFVPEQGRGCGLGTALMNEAERIATEHACAGIWLATYEFQARGFYEKLGFELFGTLGDHPIGQSSFFMRKSLRVDSNASS